MARPIKEGADYFPHEYDLRHDRRMLAVRRAYGFEGYAVYAMMLETLTDSRDFSWTWNAEELELVAGDFQMAPERLEEILNYLVERHLFEREGDRLYSEELVERMRPLMDKRENQRIQKKKKKETAKTPETEGTPELSPDKKICPEVFASENAQSKVEQSKAKQSKQEERKIEQSKAENASSANPTAAPPNVPAETPGTIPPVKPAALPADPGWWPRQKDLLCREFATILRLAPYGAAVQGEWKTILALLDEVHALCRLGEGEWPEAVGKMRQAARECRESTKPLRNPLGLFITKLRDTWPGIGRKAG